MSPNEADFDLREITPLPRNTLHTCGVVAYESTRQRTNLKKGYRGWSFIHTRPKDETGQPDYPVSVRDTAKRGMGRKGNRHLSPLAEFIFMNVGCFRQDAKMGSPSRPDESVGAVVVVRGWESQPHGEGPQSVRTFYAKVAEC